MSVTRTSTASNGTTSATAVTLSSLASQTTNVYNLLIVSLIFNIVVVVSLLTCLGIWLKKRKTSSNTTTIDSEHVIPLASLNNRPRRSLPRPPTPARRPGRPIQTPPFVLSGAPRSTQTKRFQTVPPLSLSQRPILPQEQQIHGADYSSGRPRRFGDDHLAQSGPSVSANVQNHSAYENHRSRQLDKIYNS